MRVCRQTYASTLTPHLALGAALGAVLSVACVSTARAEGGVLPQLDVSAYPAELFWLAVTFALLYALMSRVALPGVERTKENRQTVIGNEIEAAEKAGQNAEAARAHVEKALAEARTAAQAKVNGMMTANAAKTAAERATQEDALKRRLQEAEAQIAARRDAALKAVEESTAELADSIVQKVLALSGKGGV